MINAILNTDDISYSIYAYVDEVGNEGDINIEIKEVYENESDVNTYSKSHHLALEFHDAIADEYPSKRFEDSNPLFI